jgi:hypothetical protein
VNSEVASVIRQLFANAGYRVLKDGLAIVVPEAVWTLSAGSPPRLPSRPRRCPACAADGRRLTCRPQGPIWLIVATDESGQVTVMSWPVPVIPVATLPPCGRVSVAADCGTPFTSSTRPCVPMSTSTRSPATSIAAAVLTETFSEPGKGCWRSWSWKSSRGSSAATNSPAAWKS